MATTSVVVACSGASIWIEQMDGEDVFDVYKGSGSTWTLVGSNVAGLTVTFDTAGTKTTYWTCPPTSLVSTDAVKVTMKTIQESVVKGTYSQQTAALNGTSLSNAQWSFVRTLSNDGSQADYTSNATVSNITYATSTSVSLAGSMDGVGSFSGSLVPNVALAGAVAGSGSFAGSLLPNSVLVGSMDGSGEFSGSLTPLVFLSGTLAGYFGMRAIFEEDKVVEVTAIDWTIPRQGVYRYYRVDYTTRLEIEELTTILAGGSITRNMYTDLKEAGKLPAIGPLSLGDDLVRIYYVVEDDNGNTEAVALATMHAVAESVALNAATESCELTLYSALLTLQQDTIETSLTIPAGTVAVSEAASLCAALGLPVVASPSVKTLGSDVSFDAGTTYLKIVNHLLGYAGFWSVLVDGWGRVVMSPYQSPDERAVSWEFVAGENCIFLPSVELASDSFKVPNKCVLVCSNADTTLAGSYTNDDPASPFSTVSRGRTITMTETVNDAEDVDDLNGRARARLQSATAATETVKVQHAYAPVTTSDVVRLRWDGRNVDLEGAIQAQEIALVPSALVTTEAKRIWR